MTEGTISELPLLIQFFLGAGAVILVLYITFLISSNDIKPKWFRVSLYSSLYLVLGAFFKSWDEERFFSAFGENFVALLFRYGGFVLAVFCGMVAGKKISKKTSRIYDNMTSDRLFFRKQTYFWAEVLGWVIGIIVALVVILILFAIVKDIPGVGWRLGED